MRKIIAKEKPCHVCFSTLSPRWIPGWRSLGGPQFYPLGRVSGRAVLASPFIYRWEGFLFMAGAGVQTTIWTGNPRNWLQSISATYSVTLGKSFGILDAQFVKKEEGGDGGGIK